MPSKFQDFKKIKEEGISEEGWPNAVKVWKLADIIFNVQFAYDTFLFKHTPIYQAYLFPFFS
jgi:hypothetical protein